MTITANIHSRFITALRTQTKTADAPATDALLCPYCPQCRIPQNLGQLYNHAMAEHRNRFEGLEPAQVHAQLKEAALKPKAEQSSKATSGGRSAPDLTSPSIELAKDLQSSPFSKKRPAEFGVHARRGKAPTHTKTYEPDYSRDNPRTIVPERNPPKPSAVRLFDSNKGTTQSDLNEFERYDHKYPGLLLERGSRPISQEQLDSEVTLIYTSLTTVETSCIRAQAAAAEHSSNPNHKPGSAHWQTLTTLHRTLLREHHDFLLASQHPSAPPTLSRLATKYSMPARIWKNGIHPFLELLRRGLPSSIDYMLAFIYLAYQMLALFYETIPAFEDIWVEYLGHLCRYRMAIGTGSEDIRDRETWASVARLWYTKAADKEPLVGRLYHHLAVLARPNALQQLYYYTRSLSSVQPFPSARKSILTLVDPHIRAISTSSTSLPINSTFIKIHGILFYRLPPEEFKDARLDFQGQLDNYISRVTVEWKEQGVYIAITNIAGYFNYGVDDAILRQILLHNYQGMQSENSSSKPDKDRSRSVSLEEQPTPTITDSEILSKLEILSYDATFSSAHFLTMSTFSLVLRRVNDKNVLPHVHVLLSFLSSFASIRHVARLIDRAPWAELVTFLNTLLKAERISKKLLLLGPIFPVDNLPLPEDYLMRGQIWCQWYFPDNWFARERDEEERYLELPSTVKSRIERVLLLGHHLSTFNRWFAYNYELHTFSIITSTASADKSS